MQIALTTNRTITLVRLRQWFTYYGLLAGIPRRAGNQEIIDRALAKAKAVCMQGINPTLIPAVATPMQYRDVVRVIGGEANYFAVGKIDANALRAFQSNFGSPLKCPYKPLSDGFELDPTRAVRPNPN